MSVIVSKSPLRRIARPYATGKLRVFMLILKSYQRASKSGDQFTCEAIETAFRNIGTESAREGLQAIGAEQ